MICFGSSYGDLDDSPIREEWVLAGKPVTRSKLLSRSADGSSSTYIWDCTAGRFNWEYFIDETVYVIEGSVVVNDGMGNTRTVNAGDTIFFPAGSRAEWTVDRYVRKVAFLRTPVPWMLNLPVRALRKVRRMVAGNGGL